MDVVDSTDLESGAFSRSGVSVRCGAHALSGSVRGQLAPEDGDGEDSNHPKEDVRPLLFRYGARFSAPGVKNLRRDVAERPNRSDEMCGAYVMVAAGATT